jgi:hypothetical protein
VQVLQTALPDEIQILVILVPPEHHLKILLFLPRHAVNVITEILDHPSLLSACHAPSCSSGVSGLTT